MDAQAVLSHQCAQLPNSCNSLEVGMKIALLYVTYEFQVYGTPKLQFKLCPDSSCIACEMPLLSYLKS